MFEKCSRFIRKYKKVIISNDDDRFKRELTEAIEEIIEKILEMNES
ncbi:hypothetical protein LCGC14_2373560 [marine sediment metagenome]|uniref:Uncharacterized protein n=1 Tax=marine sediment metagenome TaxID=412755 RepID=A0A0F9CQ97_9ZZZZ